MGRSATFYCRTCRTSYYLGYGSYGTWLDHCRSVEELDDAGKHIAGTPPQPIGNLRKNQNMRQCLEGHAGHTFETHSSEWTSEKGGVLYGAFGIMGSDVPLIKDYGEWEHVDLTPDHE